VLRDLSATNGTYLQERTSNSGQTTRLTPLVRTSAALAIGQPITLGSVTAVVRYVEETATCDAVANSAIVHDAKLRDVYAQAFKAARSNITVLVFGETGVGKELLARSIHEASRRADGQFLAINCGALSESLLESELFGSEKGAYTGATQSRPGFFEATNGGTILLDEVGELTPTTQVRLLRVLEEGSVLRVGARSPRPIDVRVIAATNRDLAAEVAAGNFRKDLYFRLNGLSLTIPPLRERTGEIEQLARRFVRASCSRVERPRLDVSGEALALLRGYAWPGNVRELRNVMDRAVVLCNSGIIGAEHLPETLRKPPPLFVARDHEPARAPIATTTHTVDIEPQRFRAEIKSLERLRIVEALQRSAGNQTRAAGLLGISRRTLVARLGEFDLPRPRKRGLETAND